MALRYRRGRPVVFAVRTPCRRIGVPAGPAFRGKAHRLRVLDRRLGFLSNPPGEAKVQIHKAFMLFGLAAILVWGTAAQDEGIKIGVVDREQAIISTTEGKAAR